jgi:hypothetical protein
MFNATMRAFGARADAVDQFFEISAPLADLRVDVGRRIVSAPAGEHGAPDHVRIVAAREDREVGRIGRDKRRLPLDEVAGKIADRLPDVARQVFDRLAQHRSGNAAVGVLDASRREVVAQPASQDLDVAAAVRAVGERHARRRAAEADAVAGADRRVKNGSVARSRCRRRWALGFAAGDSCAEKRQ